MSPVRQRPNVALLPLDMVLWRYFDLEGALNLLKTNELRFTQLAQFEDGYEGRQSKAEKVQDRDGRVKFGLATPDSDLNFDLWYVFNRFHTFASCWTSIGPNSMMMWSIYAPRAESLTLETTVGDLMNSLPEEGPEVFLGQLEYGDRENDPSDLPNPLDAKWRKWDYYSHENEVRLTVNSNSFEENHGLRCVCEEPHYRQVKLEIFPIRRIYAHPKMGENLFSTLSAQIDSLEIGLSLDRSSNLL